MKLNDNEIRDITKLLEEGKPLPEKYRFILFGDDREIELVWNGKNCDITNEVLPFQIIEHIDEPRLEEELVSQPKLIDLSTGRQLKGWTNKLIWGENKFILSSLKNGPLREEIEANGGIKLIYIDPPFDVGADFTMEVQIGDETLEKEPNILEEIAYRDTWGKGKDSFLSMLNERLIFMRDLLSNDGNIFVHCDQRLNAQIRILMDEVFGKENFKNEIIWRRTTAGKIITGNLPKNADYILWYSKTESAKFISFMEELTDENKKVFNKDDGDGRGLYRTQPIINPSHRDNLKYNYTDKKGRVWN